MIIKKACYSVLGLILYLLQANAQFKVQDFQEKDGLPQNFVHAINQDTKSNLWIASGNKLSLFDGKSFNQFETPNNTGISSLYKAANGTMWLGYNNGAIHQYNNDSLIISKQTTNSGKILNFCELNNNLYAFSKNGVLMAYNKPSNTFKEIRINENEITYNHFDCSVNNTFFLATSKGLLELNIQGEIISENDFFKGKNINSFHVTKNELLITSNKTAYNITNQTVKEIYQSPVNEINKIFQTKTGTTIITDKQKQVLIKVQHNKSFKPITKITNYTNSIFEDREGNIWLGTYGQGLVQVTTSPFYLLDAYKNQRCDISYTADDGNVWLVYDNKLVQFSPKSKLRKEFLLSKNDVNSIFMDENLNLWIAHKTGSLFCFSKNEQLQKVVIPELQGVIINHISGNKKGLLFFSTITDGVILYNMDKKQVVFKIMSKDGLPNNEVFASFYDSKNRLWMATHGGPLAVFENDTIKTFDKKNGLDAFNFNGFAEAHNGDIWIITNGQGIFRYNDHYFKSQVANQLPSKYIYNILFDNNQNVWVGHRKGLSRINATNKSVTNFAINLQLHGAIPTFSANKDNLGNIYWASEKGCLKFDYHTYSLNTSFPFISISEIEVSGKPYLNKQNLNLPYGNYPLKFVLEGVSLTNPNDLKYQYQIIGINNEWSELSTNNIIYLPRVSDGTYKIKAVAVDSNGNTTQEPITFTFSIATPIWKKWWFYLFVVTGMVVLISAIIKYRTNKLRGENEKLNQLVEDRTLQVILQNKKLEVANQQLAEQQEKLTQINDHKDKFLGMVAHDLRNPLGVIQHYSSYIVNEAKDSLSSEHLQFAEVIQSSSNFMLNMVDELLDLATIEAGKFELQKTPTNLNKLINEVIEINRVYANRKAIDIQFTGNANLPITNLDESKMHQVMNNLISNAIKFSNKNSSIEVSLLFEEDKQQFYIEVKDKGIGISDKDLAKLFQPFETTSNKGTDGEKSTGLGLVIVKKVIDAHEGKIKVKSVQGKGSVFSVIIPHIEFPVIQEGKNVGSNSNYHGLKILLVEDDKIIQALTKKILNEYQLKIDIAENGQEAVEMVKKNEYDLILMDINMPVMGGFEATKIIREELQNNEVSIVALTGYVDNKIINQCLDEKMDGCYEKPIKKNDLEEIFLSFNPSKT